MSVDVAERAQIGTGPVNHSPREARKGCLCIELCSNEADSLIGPGARPQYTNLLGRARIVLCGTHSTPAGMTAGTSGAKRGGKEERSLLSKGICAIAGQGLI